MVRMAQQPAQSSPEPEVLEGQECPICHKKALMLTEREMDVPYFGRVFLFSMDCTDCKYHKADVECAEVHEPAKYSYEITSEEDMKVRVVKSGEGTVKIPHVGSIESGPASNGYVTNIEGVLNRMKHQIKEIADNAEEKEDRKKAKNLLKKLQKIMWGQEKCKITIEDPTGNSAIIHEKAVKSKM